MKQTCMDRARMTLWNTPLSAVIALGILATAPPAQAQIEVSPLDRKSSNALPSPEMRVLVEGDPPLTEGIVQRIAAFVTYCFEIRLTTADLDRFRAVLINEWQRKDRAAIDGNLQMLRAADELEKLDPAKRELFRQTNLADGLADARKRAKTDPDMRWLVKRYEEEHRPLVPGTPALTRQATDAFAEMACFTAGEARGQKLVPNREFKDSVERLLVKQWTSMNADARKQLSAMPLTLAQLQAAWPEATPAQKEQARALWRKQLGFGRTAQTGTPAATGSGARQKFDPTGLNELAKALTRENNKHIGNYIILSNPAFYR